MKSILLISVIFAAFAVQTILAGPDIVAILNSVWNSFGIPGRTIIASLNDGTVASNYSTGLQETNDIYENCTNEYALNVSTLYMYFVQNATAELAEEAKAFSATIAGNLTATTVAAKLTVFTNLFAVYSPLGAIATTLAASLTDLNEIKIPALLSEIDGKVAAWNTFGEGKINSAVTASNNDTAKVARVTGIVNTYVANSEKALNACATTIQQNIYTLAANIYNSVSRYLKATLDLEGHFDTCLLAATTGARCSQLANPPLQIVRTAQTTLIGYQARAATLNSTTLSSSACAVTASANFLLGQIRLQSQIDAALR